MAVEFDPKFFTNILNSAEVTAVTEQKAREALAIAKASAPVDSGDYRDGLHTETVKVGDRTSAIVAGDDWKTLLVESQTGNLARALRAVKG